MAKPQIDINVPQKGLNRDQYNLGESDYSLLLNGLFDATDTGTFSLTNEMSNVLSSKFKAGFKVINATNDINSNNTYFFLVNPTTGVGEFGVIHNIQNIQNLQDLPSDCQGCLPYLEVAQPLEELEQVETNTYITLLSDSCLDPQYGFNFDINHPIRKTVIKNEKCGKTIYFTDNYNPYRYIIIDKLDQYTHTGSVDCGVDNTTPTCLDAQKLLLFRRYDIPQIKPASIELGGRLKLGIYEALIAYCDQLGNEISEYVSITNPVSIFDKNNTTLLPEELSTPTNYGIKFSVGELDENYHFYKVVIIQTTLDSVGAPQFFIEGIHPISDRTVFYTTEKNKQAIDLNSILRENIFVDRGGLLTQSANSLVLGDLTIAKEMNLQPVVNFLGSFIKWQTHIATEDLYQNGVESSLYLGYNRDEVVPFAIRFLLDGGYKTALFPLIARLPNEDDLEVISSENLDRISIETNIGTCNNTDRTLAWQYYNTATEDEDFCGSDQLEYITVTEATEKSCEIDAVAILESGSFSIELDTPYSNLTDFINEHIKAGDCNDYIPSTICDALDPSIYTEQTCEDNLYGDNCTDVTLISDTIYVKNITNETETKIEKLFPDDYAKIVPPTPCSLYLLDVVGSTIEDVIFENSFMNCTYSGSVKTCPIVYKRDFNFTNTDCNYAASIPNIVSATQNTSGYFHNYFGNDVKANLLTTKDSVFYSISGGEFNLKLSKSALWFKGSRNSRNEFLLELSKQNDPTTEDNISLASQQVRVSIYQNCSDNTPLYTQIIDLSLGIQYKIYGISSTSFVIYDGATSTIVTTTSILNNFYVAVDTPIIYTTPLADPSNPASATKNSYILSPTDGCFSVVTRDVEYSRIDINWSTISLTKKSIYTANCTYQKPIVQACKAVPFRKGEFAYWQSTENYPDNYSLYNSQNLTVDYEQIPNEIRTAFENTFVQTNNEGVYALNDNANFACKPIRHFRFPDNKVSPFMYEDEQQPFANSIIYPLGITINEEVINAFLDVALTNNLISQDKRNQISGYEIFRGDINQDRSIIASGLLYDMRNYSDNGKVLNYSSYPYNDLGNDKMNYYDNNRKDTIGHPYAGNANDKFTFHSPETDFYKPTLPSEMSVQGYMFGKSKGHFNEVKNHPKWVILSYKAKDLATELALLEVVAEVAIQIAQAGENYRFSFWAGTSSGSSINPIGATLTTVAETLSAISSVVTNAGRYRYEWIKTFRDLGQPENFASYYVSEGKYNYLLNLQERQNQIRGIQFSHYLKDGNYTHINDVTGEVININNLDREYTTFLSLGDTNPINYPTTYSSYDNGESLTFASEANICSEGVSPEITRNIASPYVALKNYNPSQYGTINSIHWLTTSYRGDLRNPRTDCLSIFGGDTYLSRHTLKRKMPLFNTTAFGLADLTPYNYRFYGNIGRQPRFYVDYEVLTDYNKNNFLFPDINYDLQFDCENRDGNYYKTPSKFYLYYYGIPSFLAETRINTNFRTAQPSPEKDFYPNVGDVDAWTQEKNVSIRKPNYYFYDNTYSQGVTTVTARTLQDNFNQTESDCRNDKPNGIMWSLPDNSENNYSDPWLIYKPLDFWEFSSKFGRLKDLRTIEREQILVRQEHATSLFNAVDLATDDGSRPQVKNLLSAFARRPLTYSETDLGYGGTTSTQSVSCEFGHFHVDSQRGQVIQIPPSGQGIEEISAFIGGKPSGMRNWFKQQLPFKILNSNISNISDLDVDNAINGVGITMGWDSRFKRVFITKKDYSPKKDCISYVANNGFYATCPPEDCSENVVTNGNFSNGLTDWYSSIGGDWIASNGRAEYVGRDELASLYQNVLVVGQTYKITLNVENNGTCPENTWIKIYAGDTVTAAISTSGLVEVTLECTNNGLFKIQGNDSCAGSTGIGNLFIDNVCVQLATTEPRKVELTDSEFFEDVSWTIAYSPVEQKWIGWYSYKPNYYIAHQNYFQTGINQSSDSNELGLWHHLLTNKSYQVFYGKRYPFIIEYMLKRQYGDLLLKNVGMDLEVHRYHNDFDMAIVEDKPFNKMWVYSPHTNSGEMHLHYNTGQLSLISSYPKTAPDGTYQEVLISKNNNEYTTNYLYNRILTHKANQPAWFWDKNQINKTLNTALVKFSGKTVLEPMRSNVFTVKLQQDLYSSYRYMLNLVATKTNLTQ